jgi:hypothetical protein
MLKSLSKPMQWMLIGVLAIAAYTVGSPILFPKPATHIGKKAVSPKSNKKTDSLVLTEDYSAHFDPLGQPIKNSFKPLIAKQLTVRGGNAALQVNNVPLEFSGGEPGWIYTGSAEIDGVLQALLENRTTGDNVFLRVGDTWKGISVEEITDDSLILASPETGIEKTLKLPSEDAPVSGPGGFTPATVNPNLRGNIGPMSLQPDGTALQDPSMGTQGGFNNAGMAFGNGSNGNAGNRRRGGGGGGRRGGGGRGNANGQ